MSDSDKAGKWSERFSEPLDERAADFNASVHFDKRLALYDIRASIAHAEMLAAQRIIGEEDKEAIVLGLAQIRREIESGDFVWRTEDEDVHFSIERRLTEIAGDSGRRLHTARSRNDQVATDLRLFLRAQTDVLLSRLSAARRALLDKAERHSGTLMAGMTHLQVAQPITFGHHLLAYEDMLARDAGRFSDARRRMNYSPLGAGALAGTSYPIDRYAVARALGFDGVCQNSMDAVSDRDFAVEFAAACALLMVHLSRFCEEVIMWNSPPFSWAALPDSLCTGSSVMPQKKNPDVPELIRGKCGRVCGALSALLMVMKSQPLAYNKDCQEDKEAVFDCADTAAACVSMFTLVVEKMTVNTEAMERSLNDGAATATELADYLTRQGTPFRRAHEQVSAAVRAAATRGLRLHEMPLAELQKHIPEGDEKMTAVLDPRAAVAARNHVGGAAGEEAKRQIARRRALLAAEEETGKIGDG